MHRIDILEYWCDKYDPVCLYLTIIKNLKPLSAIFLRVLSVENERYTSEQGDYWGEFCLKL